MHVTLKSACQYTLALTFVAAALLPAGCVDDNAKKREELQQTVAQANSTLRQATLVIVTPDNAEQFEKLRSDLKKVVSTLRSAGSDAGETGQEAAVNLLLADAGQKLAALDLARVEQTASEMRDNQTIARTQLRALLRLNEFVTAAESIDVTSQTSALDNAKSSASEQLRAASEMLAQLDEPISRLSSENSADAQKMAALRSEAEQLLRRATDEGPADGFPQYEMAVQKNREAGDIETQIAKREINLSYQYQPEHRVADAQAQQLQQFIDSIEKAKQNLNTIAQTIDAEASKTSTRVGDLRKSLDQRLSDVQAALTGPLDEAYREGLDAADKALSAVKAAGRNSVGGDNKTGKLLEAQILDTQGRLHWARARVLADQVNLLDAIISAGPAVGNVAQYQSQRGEAESAYQEATELARDAYTAAQAALPAGNSSELQAFSQSLEMAVGALSGKSAAEMNQANSAANSGAMNGTNEGGEQAAVQYQTPEELVAALNTIDPMRPETSVVLVEAVQAGTPMQLQFVQAMRDMNSAATRMMNAMNANLGAAATQSFLQMGAATTPDFTTAQITNKSADTATVSFKMLSGQPQTMELVNGTSGWRIGFDSFLSFSSAPGLATSDAITFLKAMTGIIDKLAEQIENGEITSAEDLMSAMQAASQNMAAP